MLWGGFAAFVIAFVARLLSSGDPASAVFSGCVGCLVGGWLGRLVGSYLNANLKPAAQQAEEAAPEASPRQN
jgi:hypothetical protein